MSQRRRRKSRRNRPLESLEDRCLLSTITVNSLADNTDVDGLVTLREAIQAANTDTSVDGSAAGDGHDVIKFASSIRGGTITLQDGQLRIESTLTINGDGIEIDAQSASRIFKITAGAGAPRLRDLTLRNGFHVEAGGAIQSSADELTLTGVTFVDNTVRGSSSRLVGGAIYAANSLVIEDSTFEGNTVEYTGTGAAGDNVSGGAVHAEEVTINDSTFESNQSDGAGGALTSTHGFHIYDSAVTGNTAPNMGAGLFLHQPGDADPFDGQRAIVERTAVSQNIGSGIALDSVSFIAIRDSVIHDNQSHGIEVIEGGRGSDALVVDGSTIRTNGGSGIYVTPETITGMTVIGTEISENAGVGIKAGPHFSVHGSTISRNAEGGIQATVDTVGHQFIYGQTNEFRVADTTISGNSSSTGPAAIDIQNVLTDWKPVVASYTSTIANNVSAAGFAPIGGTGGGIPANNALVGSIVAHNSDMNGTALDARCGDCYLSASAVGVVETPFLDDLIEIANRQGSVFGTADSPLDLKIGALAQHDLLVRTHALLPGSPAIGNNFDMGAMPTSVANSDVLSLLVDDVVASEGTEQLAFNVWASDLPAGTATATFELVAGSAVTGEDFLDIEPITVTFDQDSNVRQQIVVPLTADDVLPEENKTVRLQLVESTGFDVVPTDDAVGTILNDDVVRVSFDQTQMSVVEGDTGSQALEVTLTADAMYGTPFEVRVRTSDRSAAAGNDFAAIDQIVSFSGSPGESQTVSIDIHGDGVVELDERFEIELSLEGNFAGRDNLQVATPTTLIEILNDEVGISVDGSQLIVRGGSASDVVVIESDGLEIQARINNITETVDLNSIDQIVVQTHGAEDRVTLEGDLGHITAVVETGDGDDIIQSHKADLGAATFRGQGGHDQVRAGSGPQLVQGGAGNDTLLGGDGDDTIEGGADDDSIIGAGGHDLLDGGVGDDSIKAGSGHDLVRGRDGDDFVDGEGGHDEIRTGGGNDSIQAGGGNDTVDSGSGRDSISGEGGDDSIDGGDGNDSLLGGDGHDVLTGQNGSDTARGGNGDDVLAAEHSYGDQGNDMLSGGCVVSATLIGGAGDDTLQGTHSPDVLKGGSGNDSIIGSGGDDEIYGDGGHDTIHGGSGSDIIFGNGGNDYLNGDDGLDTILGGGGTDYLSGGDGADSLRGGAGRDALFGGGGPDTLSGDGGSDLVAAASEGHDDIASVWLGSGTYGSRIDQIRALDLDMVNDDRIDVFATDGGRDWLLGDLQMDLFSLAGNEIFDQL